MRGKAGLPSFSIFAAVLFFAFLGSGCASSGYTEGDYFFVKRLGAIMPVWVRGNLDSGVMIIFSHGGPGDTSQYAYKFGFFRELEKKYGVAYWDQRCSGVSQGNPDPASFTVESFAEDLELVVDTVKSLYSPNSVFLYGISWGGTLSVAYLADPARQAKVTGLIEECGTTNMPLTLETSSLILSDYAKSQVAQGIKPDFWQEAVDFFSASADVSAWGLEEFRTYAKYLSSAKPYAYATNRYPGEITGPDAQMVFLSSLSLAMFFNRGSLIPRFNILSLNLNPDMGSITVPVFIAWGQYDLNGGTTALAENLRDSLGTAPGSIHYHVFPNAGHNPCIDQPELYLPLLADFIETYR